MTNSGLRRLDSSDDDEKPNPFSLSLMSRGKATPEEATWECNFCGVVEPYQGKFNGRWFRSQCACEKATLKKKQEDEERERQQRYLTNACYTWLGDQWSDMPLAKKTFDTFIVPRQQEAYDLARLFTLQLQGTFILYGTYGTGKTHLLAAICNEIRLRGVESRFTTAPKLFKAIQERIQHNEDYNGLIHRASKTPLLVLDDIDKAKVSEFREEIYFEIIDERTKRGLPIALSTNRLTDLADYVGGAVCSRLSIGQIAVEMAGDDYRLEM